MRREISKVIAGIVGAAALLLSAAPDAFALARPPVVQRDANGRAPFGISANGRFIITDGNAGGSPKRIDLVTRATVTWAFLTRNPQLTADGSAMVYQDGAGAIYRYTFATKANTKITPVAVPATPPSCWNLPDFQLRSMNATGTVLAFIAGEGCGLKQWVWLYDVAAKTWRSPNKVLPALPAGSLGWQSNEVVLNGTGRVAAFSTFAFAGCTKCIRVFTYDWTANRTTLISKKSTGAALTDGNAFTPSISPDGKVVSFRSNATGVVAGITTVKWRVYVKNLATGVTKAITDKEKIDANGFTGLTLYPGPQLFANGTYIAVMESRLNSSRVLGPHPVIYRISDKSSAVLDNTSTGGAANRDAFALFAASAAKPVVFGSFATNFTTVFNPASSAGRIFISTPA